MFDYDQSSEAQGDDTWALPAQPSAASEDADQEFSPDATDQPAGDAPMAEGASALMGHWIESTPGGASAGTEHEPSGARMAALAEAGTQDSGSPLPHLDTIQQSFGTAVDLSGVRSHMGGKAGNSLDEMGADGFSYGNHVAFQKQPSLHLAAHEAAHYLQHQDAVQAYGGGPGTSAANEANADAIADRVVAGRSAADLLPTGAQQAGRGSAAAQGSRTVQLKRAPTRRGKKAATPPAPRVPQGPDVKYNAQALDVVAQDVLAAVPSEAAEHGKANMPTILKSCAARNIRNANQVAYMLATAEHESKFGTPKYDRSESLVEDHNPYAYNEKKKTWNAKVHTNGRRVSGKTQEELDTAYWDSAYGRKNGNKRGTTDGSQYRGRGFVQLTGRGNYRSQTQLLNEQGFQYAINGVTYGGSGNPPIDLEANPAHVNQVPDLAARVMVTGMSEGSFGRKLSASINEEKTDFKKARGSVNGTDRAADIATIAQRYQTALGKWPTVFVLDEEPAAAPASAPAPQS